MVNYDPCCYNCYTPGGIICADTNCSCHVERRRQGHIPNWCNCKESPVEHIHALQGYGGESVICDCCKAELSFWGKYTVNNGKRYCMLCTDVCIKGNYGHCVRRAYQQGYMDRKLKEHSINYGETVVPAIHPSYIPPGAYMRYIPSFEDIIKQADSMNITLNQFQWAVKRLAERIRK